MHMGILLALQALYTKPYIALLVRSYRFWQIVRAHSASISSCTPSPGRLLGYRLLFFFSIAIGDAFSSPFSWFLVSLMMPLPASCCLLSTLRFFGFRTLSGFGPFSPFLSFF